MSTPADAPAALRPGDSRLLWRILENVEAAVLITDATGAITFANAAYCSLTGFRPEELRGRVPTFLRRPGADAEIVRDLREALGSCGRFRGRLVDRRKDGGLLHAEVSLVSVASPETSDAHVLCTLRDASAEHDMEVRLATLAQEVTQARDTTVLALASLAEQRDHTTGAHLQRIEAYTSLMMEWALATRPKDVPRWANDARVVGRCAVLHDIGKVGIPDSILLKAGPLNEAEQEVMRQHPRMGAEIIDRILRVQPDSAFLRVAREIVAYHHEAWDGTGYPYGLAGGAIPVTAQIVAVADVLDALTSERPYKPAHGIEETVAWVTSKAGRQLSPLGLEALHSRLPDIAAVYRRLGDPPSQARIHPSGIGRPGAPRPAAGRGEVAAPRPARGSVMDVLDEAIASRLGGEVLVRSGDDVGRLYVFQGRVAWAQVTTVKGVLTDRLSQDSGLPRAALRRLMRDWKRTGGNFGEMLVEKRLISAECFREILRAHVGERVKGILRLPDPVAMFAPQPRGYSKKFTFTLRELLEAGLEATPPASSPSLVPPEPRQT